MHTTLKAINAAEGRVGGYLVVWGNPQQRDLQGEYFSPESELGLDWYDQRPVLYHHGLDGNMKAAVIGVIDRLKADTTGVWAEAQLDVWKQTAKENQKREIRWHRSTYGIKPLYQIIATFPQKSFLRN